MNATAAASARTASERGQPGRQAQPGRGGEREQQRAGRGDQQRDARPVELPGRTELPGPRQQVAPGHECHDADRNVHPVDRAPADRRGQQPAQRRAEREPDGLGSGLDTEREAHPHLRRARRHQGHAVGLQHGRADGLDQAEHHQDAERGRQPAGRGGHREDGKAVGVHELAADGVAEAPGRGEHRDQAEQVAERHPLDGGDRGAELTLHGRERDRDDARVELAHERAEADHAHGEPGCPRVLPDHGGPRRLMQNTSVSEHSGRRLSRYFCKRTIGERLPGLTPDMPGVVLALAFRTGQTQGGGVVRGLRIGRSARVRRESA